MAAREGLYVQKWRRPVEDLTRGRIVPDDRNSREEWIVLQKQTTWLGRVHRSPLRQRGNRFCLTCHSSVYAFLYPIADISCLSCAFTSPWRVFHYLITFQKEPSVFLLLGRDPGLIEPDNKRAWWDRWLRCWLKVCSPTSPPWNFVTFRVSEIQRD